MITYREHRKEFLKDKKVKGEYKKLLPEYRGEERLLRNGINIEPADEFLLELGSEMTNKTD